VKPFVAVAVHVNVAVNDHRHPASPTNFPFGTLEDDDMPSGASKAAGAALEERERSDERGAKPRETNLGPNVRP
jgi:hypothetical protein